MERIPNSYTLLLPYFSKLQILQLVNVGLTDIQGFDHCTQLEQLILSENNISEIQNLNNCKQLTVLVLDFNRIHKI